MGMRPKAWADEQWAAETGEHACAADDQDEMSAAFCGCVDSGCPELELEDAEWLMCGVCELDDEGDVDEGSTTCEFVCGVDFAEDSNDDLVATEYRSLRDLDG